MAPIFPIRWNAAASSPTTCRKSLKAKAGRSGSPHYEPDQQSLVDRWRLRYDEFITTADRAFGGFMSDIESAGRLREYDGRSCQPITGRASKAESFSTEGLIRPGPSSTFP